MRVITRLVPSFALFSSIALTATPVQGQLTIQGADGSDGSITVASGTTHTIDLEASGVVVGAWDTPGTGSGVYDPELHLFVMKLTTLEVQSSGTLAFTFVDRCAPVMLLVEGTVTIAGTVDLRGQDGATIPDSIRRPGPGGYRSLSGVPPFGPQAAGLGPGGGEPGTSATSQTYVNDFLVPLLGGSAGGSGGGSGNHYWAAGGAGGGAILIATPSTIQLTGTIDARGGNGLCNGFNQCGGAGSGGVVRLIADEITGTGSILSHTVGFPGFAPGKIRLETLSAAVPAGLVSNCSPAPIQAGAASTPVLVPEPTFPQCRILSIGGVAVPDDPEAAMSSALADVFLAASGPIPFVIVTENLDPTQTSVSVRLTPRTGTRTIVGATHQGPDGLGGELWSVSIDVPSSTPCSVVVVAE